MCSPPSPANAQTPSRRRYSPTTCTKTSIARAWRGRKTLCRHSTLTSSRVCVCSESGRSSMITTSIRQCFRAAASSIVNGILLKEYRVPHARNLHEKLYCLGEGLESIRGTVFRQVRFAEFRLAIYEEIEQGPPLSGARVSEIYCGLLKKYH